MIKKILEYMTIVNTILCFVTYLFGIGTIVFGKKIKKMLIYKKAVNRIDDRTAVLIIQIGKNDIENAVKMNLESDKKLKKINSENIFKVDLVKQDLLDKKDWEKAQIQISKTIQKMNYEGINKVHLFMATALPFASMTGFKLANTFEVLVYQHINGKYSFIGLLKK